MKLYSATAIYAAELYNIAAHRTTISVDRKNTYCNRTVYCIKSSTDVHERCCQFAMYVLLRPFPVLQTSYNLENVLVQKQCSELLWNTRMSRKKMCTAMSYDQRRVLLMLYFVVKYSIT